MTVLELEPWYVQQSHQDRGDGVDLIIDMGTIESLTDQMAERMVPTLHPETTIAGIRTGGEGFTNLLMGALEAHGFEPREASWVKGHTQRGRDSTGVLDIEIDLADEVVNGSHLLVVDDLVDRGITFGSFFRHFRVRGAAGVRGAVLLDRPINHVDNFCLIPGVDYERAVVLNDTRYIFGFRIDNGNGDEGRDFEGIGADPQ